MPSTADGNSTRYHQRASVRPKHTPVYNCVIYRFSGIGVGMTRDCSTLMVAQYFKRKREFVEIFIVSGSGLGIAVMSTFIKGAIRYCKWPTGTTVTYRRNPDNVRLWTWPPPSPTQSYSFYRFHYVENDRKWKFETGWTGKTRENGL